MPYSLCHVPIKSHFLLILSFLLLFMPFCKVLAKGGCVWICKSSLRDVQWKHNWRHLWIFGSVMSMPFTFSFSKCSSHSLLRRTAALFTFPSKRLEERRNSKGKLDFQLRSQLESVIKWVLGGMTRKERAWFDYVEGSQGKSKKVKGRNREWEGRGGERRKGRGRRWKEREGKRWGVSHQEKFLEEKMC